jgi:hypothetical protein
VEIVEMYDEELYVPDDVQEELEKFTSESKPVSERE